MNKQIAHPLLPLLLALSLAWALPAAAPQTGKAKLAPAAKPHSDATKTPPVNQVNTPQAIDQSETDKAKPTATGGAGSPTAAKPKDEDRLIIKNADHLESPDNHIFHLRGHVIFANRDATLYCDAADYDRDKDTARATGHLKITNPDSVITGDLIEADFGKKLLVITGNVTVITQRKRNQVGSQTSPNIDRDKAEKSSAVTSKGKPNKVAKAAEVNSEASKKGSESQDFSQYQYKKTVITCDRLEYYYADDVKKMIATPRIKAVQEDKTVWADKAVYEDIPAIVTLTGNVVIQTKKGDEMHCTKAVVSVNQDWIQAENMSGVTLRQQKGAQPEGSSRGENGAGPQPKSGSSPPTGANSPHNPPAPPSKPPTQGKQ